MAHIYGLLWIIYSFFEHTQIVNHDSSNDKVIGFDSKSMYTKFFPVKAKCMNVHFGRHSHYEV